MADLVHAALIADDDEFFRMAMSSILSDRLGMPDVIEAGSFDEAVEQLEERAKVSIALFDLSMPGMNSPANLRTVREHFPATRVVVVSSSRRRDDILAALEAGVHGYIPKGPGVDELTRALELVLGGLIYVPPSLANVSAPAEGKPAIPLPETTPASPVAQFPTLTLRQREVLELLVQGRSNKEIARTLDLGEGTVKIHLAALFRNLGAKNRSAAAALGAQLLSSLRDSNGSVKKAPPDAT